MVSFYLCNLTFRTTAEKIRQFFGKYGFEDFVGDIYIPKNYYSINKSKGYAFVRFYAEEYTKEVIKLMHDQVLDGRRIIIRVAKSNGPDDSFNPHRQDFRSNSRSRSQSRSRSNSRSRSKSRSTSRSNRRSKHSSRSQERSDFKSSSSKSKHKSRSTTKQKGTKRDCDDNEKTSLTNNSKSDCKKHSHQSSDPSLPSFRSKIRN